MNTPLKLNSSPLKDPLPFLFHFQGENVATLKVGGGTTVDGRNPAPVDR